MILHPLCFAYEVPADGVPHLASWMSVASDIFFGGFEGHREAIEVKVLPPQPGQFPQVTPIKGCGRTSILLFALVWTYIEWKDDLNNAELEDFKRLLVKLMGVWSNFCHHRFPPGPEDL